MKAIADHIRYPLFMNKSSPRSSVTLDPALPEFPDFPEPFDAGFRLSICQDRPLLVRKRWAQT
jgi:hypothetical protein